MDIRNQPRVLIVEDDVQARSVLATIVRFNNYEVFEADNGVEALKVVRISVPHVVISDLQMPVMDGYTFLRLMAAYFPETGTIALSGAFEGKAGTSRSVAADAFFSKGANCTKNLLNCVDDLAGLFPLRPSWKASLRSVAWVSEDMPDVLWIACRNCLHCFSSRSFRPGIHEARCPSCSAELDLLLEKSRCSSTAA